MENFLKTIEYRELPDGKIEIYRVYYDKYQITFDTFIILETLSIYFATKNNWKIFKGLHSDNIGNYLICKN